MYKQYLKIAALIFIALMLCVALINIFVDPGEIYFKKIISAKNSNELTSKLLSSENGVIQTGWNERLVKAALAKAAGDFDCVVLGSSRVMQISIIRNTGGIKRRCNNLVNLGVSGGGIEDISIFSYLLLNNSKQPKRVFIGVDPWTLKFGMDSRYGAYNHLYKKMNVLLGREVSIKNSAYSQKVFENLFNGKYFYQSIKLLIKGGDANSFLMKEIQYPKAGFSYVTGYSEAVTLADGSHVYAKSWIEAQKNNEVELGGGGYKINDVPYDPISIEYLKKIIGKYQEKGIEVELLMIPYHPNVFKLGQSQTVKTIKLIDQIVKEFAKENSLKYHGSFMPDIFGCKNVEFYDFMHPTNECLNRIDIGT